MEYMFLNSILRSPSFPLQDAWLSGHAISYYYLGYFLAAILTRLAGTPPAVAFNLSLALWFGLAASAAFGLLLELITLVERRHSEGAQKDPPGLSGAVAAAHFTPARIAPAHITPAHIIAALLAPVFLLLVGNLYGVLGLAHRNGWLANARLPAVVYDFGSLSEDGKSLVESPGIRAGWLNLWEWLDLKRLESPPVESSAPTQWRLDNWFYAARVLHDRDLLGREQEAIDENPAFSFLLGDLHPHLLSLPFVLLVIGLALQWLLSGQGLIDVQHLLQPREIHLGQGILPWAFAGILLGSLIGLNTWDFPIYAGLFLLVMLIGAATRAGGLRLEYRRGLKDRLPGLILGWFALVALSVLAYLPFLLTFQSQAGGVLPNVITPTRFQQLLVFFLPVLASCVLFVARVWGLGRAGGMFDRRAAWISGLGILALLVAAAALLGWVAVQLESVRPYIDQMLAPLSLEQALPLILQRRLVEGGTAFFLALMIGVLVGLAVGILKSQEALSSPLRQPAVLFILALLTLGALLVIGPEFLFLRDNFAIRMNTLFKFYFQAWVLWSLAGAFGLWWMLRFGGKWLRLAAILFAGLPLLLGLVFLPAGLASKTAGWSIAPHLDGMRYFAQQYPHDWAAIQWLQANAPAGSVILEGSRGAYWVEGRSGRISMATGLPTYLGWANHERQWRGPYFEKVANREDFIRILYRARDWKNVRQLLQDYQVEYVLFSDLERDWYEPTKEAVFRQFMKEVFRSGDVVIYQRR
jgi:YYY domain-containing protein